MLQNPAKKRLGIADYILSGAIDLVYPVGIKRLLRFFDISEQAHTDCAVGCPGAWYLEMLCVSKDRKGQGLGSNLLQSCVIPYARAHGGKQLALITNTEPNRIFYTKNGFSEFSSIMLHYKTQSVGNWSFLMNFSDAVHPIKP